MANAALCAMDRAETCNRHEEKAKFPPLAGTNGRRRTRLYLMHALWHQGSLPPEVARARAVEQHEKNKRIAGNNDHDHDLVALMIDEARLYRLRFFGNRAGLEGAIDRLRKVHDKLASGTASRVTVFALDAEEARLALALAHQSPKANGGQCRRRAADLAEKLIARAEAWNHRLRIAEAHLLAAIAKPDQCRAHLAAFASLREELGFRLLDGPQALTTYDIDPVAQRRW